MALGGGKQAHLGEVLEVECHRQQCVAQFAVKVGERLEMAKVQIDILAVVHAADMLGEELTVGIDAEELALLAQMGGGLLLGDKAEGDALRIHMGNLLLNGEHGLGMAFGCARRHVDRLPHRCAFIGRLVRFAPVFHPASPIPPVNPSYQLARTYFLNRYRFVRHSSHHR